MQRDNPAIIIMAKAPRPGMVKTRLSPVLSDSQCVELAGCFLRDTATIVSGIDATIIIASSPPDGVAEISALLPSEFQYTKQKGADLGERLQTAIEEAYSNGFGPICVIGTDSPTLPAEYVEAAFEHLENNNNGVVVGPTDDGGYYLIGMSRPASAIFRDIEWSSERVYEQTISNIRKIHPVDLLELPSWYDVDTPNDLQRLIAEIEGDLDASIAPKTSAWLAANRQICAGLVYVS